MKFLEYNKVLCLSPHPDDIEYSVSGTIMKYQDTEFHILCLSNGGDYDISTKYNRFTEVENSWKTVSKKCNNYRLYYSDNSVPMYVKDLKQDGWINYIESNFDVSSYDAIIVPSDLDSHFEHKLVSEVGYTLTRMDKISVVEYYSPSTLETWIPNLFVDISSVYEDKLKILNEFKSQLHRKYFTKNAIDGYHTNYRCSKRGMGYVEQFKTNQLFL